MESKRERAPLGIIWDFDGTLFDTQQKNLTVTRAIVSQVLGKAADEFPVLRSVEEYARAQSRAGNWRDFYSRHFDLDEAATEHAGGSWVDFQLEDETLALPIEGVTAVIEELADFPQGIVSQNSRQVILQILQGTRLGPYFGSIIGYAEVPLRRPKPEPDGILLCLRQLTAQTQGTIVFIGDHEIDTLTARNANIHARRQGLDLRFVSVAAAYHEVVDTRAWAEQPDFVVGHPSEILELIREL